jgi:PAS domain-containing protein
MMKTNLFKILELRLRILWPAVFLFYTLAFVLVIRNPDDGGKTQAVAIFSLSVSTAIWVYLFVRLWILKKRFTAFFRRILTGDYNTGIKKIPRIEDEFTDLVRLGNRMSNRLREYDELRAERTGLSYRALELITRNVKEGIMVANIEKGIFRLNPAIQERFGVKQETLSFDSVEKQEENRNFFRLFLSTAVRDGVAREGTAVLKLPVRDAMRKLSFRFIPLRDRSEKVKLVIIFAGSPGRGSRQNKRNETEIKKSDTEVQDS